MRKETMQKIIPPTNCPSCNSILTWQKDVLYCISDSCGIKIEKSIEHWAKTLKIKGLGPKAIQKLGLFSILDLYDLTVDDIQYALGSEKLATKLFSEIQKSRLASLNNVLPAFGIPIIGNSATQKLCQVITDLHDLTEKHAKDAGLGPKAVLNLMTWYNDKYLTEIEPVLPFNPTTEARVVSKVPNLGIVCISGKLKSFKTKAEAETALTKVGYTVKSSLTKDVTILINESGVDSAKTTKARNSGVTVITDLKQLIG